MRKFSYFSVCIFLFLTVSCKDDAFTACIEEEAPTALAREAYVYAFAAVENNKAIGALLNNPAYSANRFVGRTELATPEDQVVVTPNNGGPRPSGRAGRYFGTRGNKPLFQHTAGKYFHQLSRLQYFPGPSPVVWEAIGCSEL